VSDSPTTDSKRASRLVAKRASVLVVEDDESLLRVARHNLEQAGYEVSLARNAEEGLAAFEARDPDAVVTDVRMPGGSGTELLDAVLTRSPGTPVLVMTGYGTVSEAVAAMKRGAVDYLTKPVDWDEVVLMLERALDHRRLKEENRRLRDQLRERTRFENLVGDSPPMQALFEALHRLTHVDTTVLVQGESGTGKELVARALHFQGARAEGPFVPVNCGAIPGELVESSLFGHEKGAFTGADRLQRGAFEEAHGGTLFLDEVGEIPLAAQPALLRALSERVIRRVGGETTIPVDVRVIAATNRDLEAAVAEGDFREDLYWRLAVVPLRVPPLRERAADVPALARHLLDELKGEAVTLGPEAVAALQRHPWPGNVRELRNALERALVLRADIGAIVLADLPDAVRNPPSVLEGVRSGGFPEEGLDLAQLERECLQRSLQASAGNQTRAAELLGITRQTLIYRLTKHGLR